MAPAKARQVEKDKDEKLLQGRQSVWMDRLWLSEGESCPVPRSIRPRVQARKSDMKNGVFSSGLGIEKYLPVLGSSIWKGSSSFSLANFLIFRFQ